MERYHRYCDLIGWMITIGFLLYVIVIWHHIPTQIASHFNFVGEIDQYGPRSSCIPIVLVILFISTSLSFTIHSIRKNQHNIQPSVLFCFSITRVAIILFLMYVCYQSIHVAPLPRIAVSGFIFMIVLLAIIPLLVIRKLTKKGSVEK